MNFKTLLMLFSIGLLTASCQKDEEPDTSNASLDQELERVLESASNGIGKSHYLLPESSDYSNIPQDPKNPLTKEKVNLGALLYHETGLAINPMHIEGTGTYSCASCHFASAGFQAGRHQGIADGGMGFGFNGEGRRPAPGYDHSELDVQPIRTPSALNIAYQDVILWNGQFGATGTNAGTEANWTPDTPKETNSLGYEGTETQAIAGLSVHRMEVTENICNVFNYKQLFDQAFSDVPEADRYDREYAGLAIAAYERTLLANQAPFQRWIKGQNNAMTAQEKRGAILFFEKASCATCHNGPSLANMEFHAIGMKDLFENQEATYGADVNSDANLGRFSFTGRDQDRFKFKVPQLYNLADSPF